MLLSIRLKIADLPYPHANAVPFRAGTVSKDNAARCCGFVKVRQRWGILMRLAHGPMLRLLSQLEVEYES
jgi:hypothetical protein